MQWSRFRLELGILALDITPPPQSMPIRENEVVVVVAHGLTGGYHESYVRAALTVLTGSSLEGGLEFRAVVLNSRGCNNSPVLTPKLYHVCSHSCKVVEIVRLKHSSMTSGWLLRRY